MAEPIKMPCGL